MTRIPLTLTLAALLAAAAGAQNTKIVPAGAAAGDGNTSTPFFSGYGGGIAQQIFHSAAVTQGSAVIREVRLRADASSVNEPMRSFSAFEFYVGYTSVSPASMTSTFASNRTSTLTKVFSGQYNLPGKPGKQLFNISWKLSTPLVYAPSKGHLLLEWRVPIPPTKSNYFLDAHKSSSVIGTQQRFGTSGGFTNPELYQLSTDVSQLKAGGVMELRASSLVQQYPAIAAFGFSNKSYGPLPLPFDLTPLGAPGNSLYTSLDLMLPCKWTGSNGRLTASASFQIPNVSGLDGFTMYGQMLFGDPTASKLGLVFSEGLAMTLPTAATPGSLLGTYDHTRPTGSLMKGTSLVVEFEGVLP